MNSFCCVLIESYETKIHAGIKNADKTMKKSEIPSIPKEKWMFHEDAHWISVINWNWDGPKSFTNKIHKKRETKKVNSENPRAVSRAIFTSRMKKRLITPTKGRAIQVKSR